MIASKRLRAVMTRANREAQAMNHEFIGTEHLLLGLVAEGGVGCGVLRGLGVDPGDARREVLRVVQHGPDMITLGTLPQTPRAKKCVEYAIEEAGRAGRDTGTGELLLGLLREEEGVAAHILMSLGVLRGRTLDDVRRAVEVETLRAEDDAPPDTLRMGADVGGAWHPVAWYAAYGALVSSPMAVLATFLYWPYMGSAAVVIAGGTILAVCVAGGALFGWDRAVVAANLRSRTLTDLGSAWSGASLADKRRILADAIAAKFGPLDEARRDSIQNYDQQRIAETAQRLPGAVRIEDLDGDTP